MNRTPRLTDIRTWRKQAGMTQQQLADASGLSRNYISMLERYEVDPENMSLGTLRALARALDMPLGQLVELRGEDTWRHGFMAGWNEANHYFRDIAPLIERKSDTDVPEEGDGRDNR